MLDETRTTKGYVEGLVNNRVLTGWVYCKRQSKAFSDELVISVYSAELKLLGVGACTVGRPDLAPVKNDNTFGFHITLDNAMTFGELSSVIIKVSSTEDPFSHDLTYTAGLKKKIARGQFQNNMRVFRDDVVAKSDNFVMSTLKQLIDYDWNTDDQINPSKSESTQVCIHVGHVSRGKIAISGKDGHFFLYAGSNNLDRLYARRGSCVYKQWVEVLKVRQKRASEQGIKFLQLIVPEKQSVLPALYPSEIQVPTENLQLLEEELASINIPHILSCDNFYSKFEQKELIFKKTDTHFTTTGAKLTVIGMLSKLDINFTLATTELKEKLISGDLGNKYMGANFTESVQLLASQFEPTLIKQHNPAKGVHVGIMRTWENQHAPNKMKVMVFGNSFFERGSGSTCLSWWFARLFSEFQFYWSSACDWDLVEQEKPDIVICQTIERFLTRIPKS